MSTRPGVASSPMKGRLPGRWPRSGMLRGGVGVGGRGWGVSAQVCGVRRGGDWGIGDFGDLASLCRGAGTLGAGAVGINPLHALFAAEPRHFSPYSPSSRVWLGYLYLDVTPVPRFPEDSAAHALAPAHGLLAAR